MARKTEARVLAAARRLFYARGFEAVGIEAIAEAAGVSRTTIYARFGDKRALFRAVIAAETGGLAGPELGAAAEAGDLESRLAAFGDRFLELVSRPEVIELDRAIAREARANPDLVADFLGSGPEEARRMASDLLAAGVAAGELRTDLDVGEAALDLVSLLLGPLLIADRYGGATPPDPQTRARRARRAAQIILAAGAPSAR